MYAYQQQQYQYHYRRSSSSSTASTWSADDNAQMTMMPAYNHPNYMPTPYANRRKSSASASSERSCGGLTVADTKDLWKCMLELQSEYGCYTSARIDVAMEAGDEGVNLMRESLPFIIIIIFFKIISQLKLT